MTSYMEFGFLFGSLQGNPYCKDTSKDPDGIRCFCEQYCAISGNFTLFGKLRALLL